MALVLRKTKTKNSQENSDSWKPLLVLLKILFIMFFVFSIFHWIVMKKVQFLPVSAGTNHQAAAQSQSKHTAKLYTVKQGDTLWSIAIRLYPMENPDFIIRELKQLNGLSKDMIKPGQPLKLPEKNS